MPRSAIDPQCTNRRQNHHCASTSRPDIAKLARVTMTILSFMNSAGQASRSTIV